MTNEKNDAMSVGIELMTAWVDQGDELDFLIERMKPYMDDPERVMTVISGLVNVAGSLLIEFEAQGQEPQDVLQRIAMLHARANE